MGQKSGQAVKESAAVGGNCRGCGHDLLGVGLVVAVLVKKYLEENKLAGTVKLFDE